MFKHKLPLFILLASFLSGCTPTSSSQSSEASSGTPVTPVYQGMEISSSGAALGRKNGNAIDQENPFGNPDGYQIEDYIASDMPITSSEPLAYYAHPDEEVIVTVNVYNPTSYEILSFTLNGYKYQSYQFEEGSDSEQLLLKTSVGATPGIKEYTIDQIKYVDGIDIKDVVIEGNETVQIGIQYPTEPTVNVSNVVTTKLSYEFDITILDPNQILENAGSEIRAYMFDGASLTDTIILTTETASVEFSTLHPDTLYQYALVGIYDNLSGEGLERVFFHKEAFYTNAFISIIEVIPTQSSVTFDLSEDDPDSVGTITSIELLKGETLIESLTNLTTREFTGLLSYNEYIIRVTFTYNLDDGNGEQMSVATSSFMTTAKTIPTVTIEDVIPTQTAVHFALTVTDPDSVGALTAIHLLQGQNILASLTDMDAREFADLLSDTTYTIRVTYTYDLNDGLGEHDISADYEFTTLAKSIPILTIENVIPTQTSIGFELSFEDPDQVSEITAVELYHEDTFVASLVDLELREFTGLTVNTGYSLRVTYQYDLNNGLGEQEQTISENVATLASEITITELTVLNTTNPKVGEEVHVRIYFTNPDSILITAFIINGQEVSVAGGTITTTTAIVHFIPDFAGGLYEVVIDAIRYASNGVELEQNIASAFSDSILVLGDLAVVGVTAFDGRDYINVNDVANEYLLVEISNPTGYDISQLKIDYNGMSVYTYAAGEITMPDANHVKVLWEGTSWCDLWQNSEPVTVTSITYGISGGTYSTKLLSGITKKFRLLKSDVPILISTPAELAAIEGGYLNRLVNDIDLISTSWTPISNFFGILDGNGHAIRNMSLIIENTSTEAQNIGLFGQLYGLVENLSFINAYIFVKTLGQTYVGTVVGNMGINGVIQNVTIQGTSISVESNGAYVGLSAGYLWGHVTQCEVTNSSIQVTSTAHGYAAGLVGYSWGHIDASSVTGLTLDVEADTEAVGGIVGYDEYEITRCAVEDTSITAVATDNSLYAGGIVGSGRGIMTCAVKHVDITTTNEMSTRVAGIAGSTNVNMEVSDCLVSDVTIDVTNMDDMQDTLVCGIVASPAEISRCLVVGTTFNVTSAASVQIGGLGISGLQTIIDHSYMGYDVAATANGSLRILEGEIVNLEALNDKTFYTTDLSWSETVWDLSNLNYENGLVPILIFEV